MKGDVVAQTVGLIAIPQLNCAKFSFPPVSPTQSSLTHKFLRQSRDTCRSVESGRIRGKQKL